MDNIVILNACNLTDYAYEDLLNGKSAVDLAVEAAWKMPNVKTAAVIVPGGSDLSKYFKGMKIIEIGKMSASGLIDVLSGQSENFADIFYFNADCALVDPKIAEKMYANHKKYFCEYTFADGYPAGITVEIIKPAILPALAEIAAKYDSPLRRDTIFSLIEKDINAFEIETEISSDDQRLLRVSFFPDTKRNYIQLKAFAELLYAEQSDEEYRPAVSDILAAVRKEGRLLRTLPVFFEFETTSARSQKISYLPEPRDELKSGGINEMDPADFKNALHKISGFSDDAVISLSVRNEPAFHSRIGGLAEAVLDYDKFNLLVETSGIGWEQAELEKICSLDQNRITWIIDLDALDRNLYAEMRKGKLSDYDEAWGFAERMLERFPENVYVQAVRLKKNEVDTEHFYKYWKAKTNNVIIQKYDWCCGKLEQHKVTDLSPLERLPCWHLKRDMIINIDGTVPLCRDDLENEMICGNIFEHELPEIWENGNRYYLQQLKEEYPGICRKCDEYYTYNY